jgi:hypothetical protein
MAASPTVTTRMRAVEAHGRLADQRGRCRRGTDGEDVGQRRLIIKDGNGAQLSQAQLQ